LPEQTCLGASAYTPNPVRKVPAAHKLHSTLLVAPASPFSAHHTACSAANCACNLGTRLT
jgi:hypothetical protein